MSPRHYTPNEKWEILLEALGSAYGPDEVCFRRGITQLELRRWLTVAREGALQRLSQKEQETGGTPANPPAPPTIAPPPLLETAPPAAPSLPDVRPLPQGLPPEPSPSEVDLTVPSAHYPPPGQRIASVPLTSEQIDAMFSMVSHELKEPVRGVRALCQFLREDMEDQLNERSTGYLQMLNDSATRMQSLVDGLGEYARVLRTLKPDQPVELVRLLEQLRVSLQPQLVQHNASVLIDSRLPRVMGDATALTAAFRHLLLNAVKFNTSPAPRVEVVLAPDELKDWHQILIRDNGIGIDQKYHDKVFELFQRLHRYEQYPGAGVGLAIVKKVLEAHGGQVKLESVLGEGTTVRLLLPNVAG